MLSKLGSKSPEKSQQDNQGAARAPPTDSATEKLHDHGNVIAFGPAPVVLPVASVEDTE